MATIGLQAEWYRAGSLYQIYPLSFSDSNGDGYGDLRGIIQHLDYLNDDSAESLGVQAIWLTPIYKSGMKDWGYDVIDHTAIDPIFGTMADFDELVRAVHDRGMKLLLDFVVNHTSNDHPWFVESSSDRQNPKRDWYIWADPKPYGAPPNNWRSRFGGSAWTLDATTGQYYLHTFMKEQPDLNWRNLEVRAAMLGIMRFWLGHGVDGFRLDAPLGLIKDEQLRDNPPNPNYHPSQSDPADEFLDIYTSMQPELAGIYTNLCDELEDTNGKYLISETYLSLPGLAELYRTCGVHPNHAPLNFNLTGLDWNAETFRSFIDAYEASLSNEAWPNYVLGNHDRPRLASRYGADRAKLLGMLQLTLRGLPIIYYGDELGMQNAVIKTTDIKDISAQSIHHLGVGRDGERSPMAWNAETGGGFSSGDPWLPLSPNSSRFNVESETSDPDSFLAMYRMLLHLRRTMPALTAGGYRSLHLMNTHIFAFVREVTGQRVTVLLNFSERREGVDMGKIGRWITGTRLVDGDGEEHTDGVIELEGFEGRVYELRQGGE